MRLPKSVYLWVCERLYHEAAPLYDATASLISGGRWWSWSRRAATGLRGRVVEVGPGTGHVLAYLRQRGVAAVGVELSEPMARRAGRHSMGLVARGDGRCLPIRDSSADAILATFPSQFVLDLDFWSEAARVVCPGGRLRILLDAGPAYLSAGSSRVEALDARWRVRRARVRAGDASLGMLLGRRRFV